MLTKLEPSIPKRLCLVLYKNALDVENSEKVGAITLDTLTDLIIQYKIGGYGNLILGKWL